MSCFQFYPQCLDEIYFCLLNCPKLNCKKLFQYARPVATICTDVYVVPSHVGNIPFLLTRRRSNCLTQLFSVLNGGHKLALSDPAKCARFSFKFWCPGADTVDAISIDWVGENNWMVPPFIFLSFVQLIPHLEACFSRAVIFIPKWLQRPFWPAVFPRGGLRPSVLQVDETLLFFMHLFGMVTFKSAVLALSLNVFIRG